VVAIVKPKLFEHLECLFIHFSSEMRFVYFDNDHKDFFLNQYTFKTETKLTPDTERSTLYFQVHIFKMISSLRSSEDLQNIFGIFKAAYEVDIQHSYYQN
jgi:hypothetical protein